MKLLKSNIYSKSLLYIFSGLLLITTYSCNEDEEATQETSEKLVDFVTEKEVSLSAFDRLTISYFQDITLGFEFGNFTKITRKWTDDINIFVFGGGDVPELMGELLSVIDELNLLIAKSDVQINIVNNRNNANMFFFFESKFDFGQRFPSRKANLETSAGLFFVFRNDPTSPNRITAADVYVDTSRGTVTNQRSLVREELTQALGLARDSDRFEDSIFFESTNDLTNRTNRNVEYSRLDRSIIKLLYNPKVDLGLDADEVSKVLEEILTEIK